MNQDCWEKYQKKILSICWNNRNSKNLKIVIQSFIDMKKDNPGNGYKLVLAGRKGFGFEEYEKLINESKYKRILL